MSRRDIADYLGLTMETVSRAFSELRHRKVIATAEAEVEILD
jgi:CRP-like cAMP-binding protein